MGKGEDFRSQLECENDNNDDDMILVDGLDDAIIGHTDSWNGASWGRRKFIVGRPNRAVYDRERCISILEEKGEISREEVEQQFDIDEEFDENGPIFVKVFKRRNRSLDRGKNLRSQFEEVMNDYSEKLVTNIEEHSENLEAKIGDSAIVETNEELDSIISKYAEGTV